MLTMPDFVAMIALHKYFTKGEQPMIDTARRTATEIKTELSALNDLLNHVPPASCFGDSNYESIKAQIRIIRENMTWDMLFKEYENGDHYIFCAALTAGEWLHEGFPPASEDWRVMIEEPVAA
jgi:hypothetical protein